MVGAGPSFEDHIGLVKERQALTEVADNQESEADELEGLVTWSCIQLEDAETNQHLHTLRQEVVNKKQQRERVVKHTKVY